ncbi:MAG: nucleotide exchange factor GrpE [Gammaproteobacteria bacterium]|nr:nucleotide exchange factor GrpE [Gammaproteobacteria bacterium]NNC97290.1 nucleotide exchange factor GrpE [Gammaproteobacteria bacterium]NNM13304.1 nucleotide exchange factor GrpE [Gammaproteobacteria bacterium]
MTESNNSNPSSEPKKSTLESSLDEMEKIVDALGAEAEDIEDLVEAAEEMASSEQSLSQTPLEIAEAKAQEHHENLLRLAAEMDNLRKRTTREVELARKFGIERFAKEMLLVKDSLEMSVQAAQSEQATVEAIKEGVEITMKQLDGALEKFAVKQIDADGEPFNPEIHEAMAMQPSSDLEPNTVMFVMQKGYTLNDRVLRPARVMVSREASEED